MEDKIHISSTLDLVQCNLAQTMRMMMAAQSILMFFNLAVIYPSFFSIIKSVDADHCIQNCPVSSSTRVVHPFGFSDGCQIRLNCTEQGEIVIGDFRVQRITEDNIWVEVPPSCHRPTETLWNLYGDNYAPSLQNVLLLINCSLPSVRCPIKQSELDDMLSSDFCRGTNSDNVRCISDGYKGVYELLEYIQQNKDDCQTLLSSIAVQQLPPQVKFLKLKWWLTACQCSPNADCLLVSLPSGKTGYSCQCRKGFKGDAYSYPDGPGCEEDNHGFITIIVTSVLLAGLLVGGLSLVSYIWRKRGIFTTNSRKADANHCEIEDVELPFFDLATIAKATNNFSDDNKLGEGGFGPVYKGILGEGQEVAIKRLSKSSKQGIKEFKNEVLLIAKLQHRNLVKLLGSCIEGEEKMLVYEYMPNKSLDSFIFDSTHVEALDWTKRMHIINGIVRGLTYLHQDSRLRIIHRDLKASNVLLDNELNPKISDFGLARSFGADETEANTNKVVGTYGYMPPEYVIDGLYSIKSDVYSFGVLVLEIICGKRNKGFYHYDCHLNLLGHAWKLFRKGRHLELIDASIGGAFSPSEALRLFHVGLLCVQQSPEDRPSMSAVALMLGGQGSLAQPKPPGFYIQKHALQSLSSSSVHEIVSINEVTMTPLHAR